jgi:3-methyladenine DNA glycosylase AlkD
MPIEFIKSLETEFILHKNKNIAIAQKQYMKNKFEFYGIKTPLRRELQKPFLVVKYLPNKSNLEFIVKELWLKPQRELQYFSQELVKKYTKQFEKKDIELFEFMIVNNSWWDTIDFIAVNLVGAYFKKYPEQVEIYVEKWLRSGNIWLQRSAILFQLKCKQELDTELLVRIINNLLGSKEFFINKAIGWILREYGKTNPVWVKKFVQKTTLSKLSRREAIRLLK